MARVEQHRTRYRVRMRMPDGTVGVDSSHPTRAAAEIRRKQVDVEQALDTYIDPTRARITLAEWVAIWETGHLAGPAKWAAYRSHLRIHILPAFGGTPLNQITRHTVKLFVKRLKGRLADSSVASVMTLFGLLMREAVADRRIPHNPCQGIRVVTQRAAERPHAIAGQVNQIAARIARPSDQLLVITAAYTGMRWGELAGLARANTHLDDGLIRIDPTSGPCTRSAPTSTSGHQEPETRPATSTFRPSSSPDWKRSWTTTTTTSYSPAPAAACSAAPRCHGGCSHPRSTATSAATCPRSSPACTSTTSATPTKPGSSKTTSPKSPKPRDSATGSPECAASTAKSPPP
jgi:hypothetical protein